jgi:hypothetical protein
LGTATCSSSDDDPTGLRAVRLFYTDDINGWIHEIDPATETERNFFPAPTPWISSAGSGMAFNSPAGILYFLDPSEPGAIYRIIPDESSPGLVSAVALPEPARFPYDGLGFDGKRILALDSSADWIDALNAGTGEIEQGASFPVDLESGLDVLRKGGIYASGVDPVSSLKLIHRLGMEGDEGKVLASYVFETGFDPQGIAMAKGHVFVADAGQSKIRVFRITKQGGQFVLKPVKDIDYDPPGISISALAAGLK